MRHRNKVNSLGRKEAHRKAMLSNMACSLILHKRIKTTVAKARALRTFVEPIITKSKDDTTPNRRYAFKNLQNKFVVTELFRVVTPKVGDRPGGYTRIFKIGNRIGDNAEMCYIELVDFNTTYNVEDKKKATRKKRTRRGGKSTEGVASEVNTKNETKEQVAETQEQTSVVEEEVKNEEQAPEVNSEEEKKEE